MSNLDAILDDRQTTHGDYADHAAVTQQLKAVMHNNPGWLRLNDMQAESLDMIAHKIGRILAGNPNFCDHYVDIAGYAQLIVRHLEPPRIQLRIPAVDADALTVAFAKDLQEAVRERVAAHEAEQVPTPPEPPETAPEAAKGRKVKEGPTP